ncbi:hypothetical protein M885DRAFT_14596 [Pelagophyceae sp. CCMP2097]|nr:hypothetical protein M885DRAFT_14596 [Pelagophyceae sp. CCMP2097]
MPRRRRDPALVPEGGRARRRGRFRRVRRRPLRSTARRRRAIRARFELAVPERRAPSLWSLPPRDGRLAHGFETAFFGLRSLRLDRRRRRFSAASPFRVGHRMRRFDADAARRGATARHGARRDISTMHRQPRPSSSSTRQPRTPLSNGRRGSTRRRRLFTVLARVILR